LILLRLDFARSTKFAGVEAPSDFFNTIRHQRTFGSAHIADFWAAQRPLQFLTSCLSNVPLAIRNDFGRVLKVWVPQA
jgi:hypothetical protein